MRRNCVRSSAPALLLLTAMPLGAEVSFRGQVLPLLNSHCVMCHLPGAAQAGLSLYPDARAALVDQPSTQGALPLVKPGDTEGSYLFRKLAGTHLEAGGTGASMPFQRELLAAGDLALIRQWIADGAPDN
jgi:hypothetical protein